MSILDIQLANEEVVYFYYNKDLILYVERTVEDNKVLIKLSKKQKYKLLKQAPGYYITNKDCFNDKIKDNIKFADLSKHFEEKMESFKLIPEPRTKRLCFHDENDVKHTNIKLWKDYFNYLPLHLVRTELKELRKIKYNPNNIEEGKEQGECPVN